MFTCSLIQPQAVAGSTYVLHRAVEALVTDPDTRRVTGIRLGGNCVVNCTALAAHGAYLDGFTGGTAATVGGCVSRTHRCVCITDASLLPDKQQVLAIIPPGAVPGCASTSAVRVLQFGPSACLSPEVRRARSPHIAVTHPGLKESCLPAGALCGLHLRQR